MAQELLAAWASEDFDAVQRLLQDERVELDVDYQGYFRSDIFDEDSLDTLLLRAVWIRQLGIVKLLLQRGADVDLANELEAPILVASRESHWDIVKTLVEHGADVRAFDEDGQTSLHFAVEHDQVDVVKLILDADPSGIDDRGKWNKTPLHQAFEEDARNCVRELLKHGASTGGRPPLSVAAVVCRAGDGVFCDGRGRVDLARWVLRSRAEDLDEADADGWTPLHYAANKRHSLVIKLLLKRNADPNRRDKDGWTPLHRAVFTELWVRDDNWGWTHSQHEETVDELLACSRIDVNVLTMDGSSALHYAVETAWFYCVKLLLDRGADVNAVDKSGRTPLLVAMGPSSFPDGAEPLRCVTSLIRAGADVNFSDKEGNPPLLVAVDRGEIEIVQLLLENDADADVVTKDGETALHRATEIDDIDSAYSMAKLLIQTGKANVNSVDNSNFAPLTNAIWCGNHRVVELLLESGADITAAPSPRRSLSHPHALALAMRRAKSPADCRVAIARSLCARGAKWDDACEKEVRQKHRADWCSGMRASVEHWAKQFERGVDPLTDISVEVIQNGAKSVESYVERAEESPAILRRCKICVVGPTEWGKTTLVKALTTGKGVSVNPGVDGRTVGIDLETLEFCDPSGTSYEVTLWDFAGQHEYQGAHSLFFSPRSLYLLCIDLKKYDEALKNSKHATEKFMRDNIFRWVGAVAARQKDATFVAVGTKLDLIEHGDRVKAIWKDLKGRWKKWAQKSDGQVNLHKKIVVNNHDHASVSSAIRAIKEIISASGCSVGLPAADLDVLKWIRRKRKEVSALSDADRVSGAMWSAVRLQNELLKDIPHLRKADEILKLLHGLGDVYWSGSEDHDTIIIDPSLLLEFVKEIITHNCDKDADEDTKRDLKEGRVRHETLSQFPHWTHLDDEVMFDLKCLLQQLRLAYPKTSAWDSDLIVPAYWKRLAPKPSKGLLRDRSVIQRRGVTATCEYWLVYKVPPELSDIVFEQFAVQHQKYRDRHIWANVIEDSVDGCVATAMLEHGNLSSIPVDEGQTHKEKAVSKHSKASRARRSNEVKVLDTINLQVAGSENVEKYLLAIFDAMQTVIGTFKGVGVSRFVKDPDTREDHDWDDLQKEMDLCELSEGLFFSSRPWVPPNFKHFFYKRHERVSVRVEEGLIGLQSAVQDVGGKVDDVLANMGELRTKLTVLENLARATDVQRRFPTRWTLKYDQKAHMAEIRMLCDLKEECHLDPKIITITVLADFLAKNSKMLRGFVRLMETTTQGVDPTGLVDKLFSGCVTDFQTKIDRSEKVREMVRVLDLLQGGETLVSEKVSEPVAAWFLQEFLTLHDPPFKVEQLPLLTGLISTTNDHGVWIWVHQSELNPTKCVPTISDPQNASSNGDSEDPSAAASHDQSEDSDEQVEQPEEEDDSNDDASVVPVKETKKAFSAQLRILGINGLDHQNERKVYCNWALEGPSGSTQVYCSATTPRHLDESQAPSWKDMHFTVLNVVSLDQLGECNLRVEVKRPHRIQLTKEDKSLFGGSTFLAAHVANLQDGPSPRTVVVDVELDKTKKVSVTCELTLA